MSLFSTVLLEIEYVKESIKCICYTYSSSIKEEGSLKMLISNQPIKKNCRKIEISYPMIDDMLN